MDSPTPNVDSDAANTPAPKSRTLLIVLGGVLLLACGFFGRNLILQQAAETQVDPQPPPRVGLNAPFITSADAVVDKMIELAQLTEVDMVYDLGCGDGRIIVTAALQSGCHGVGFDIDPERVAEAKKNVELHEVSQLVSIKEQDIFQVDLSESNVAMMYLLPWMMQKLTPQFEQMKPGSRIVSHDFYIEGVEPERVAKVAVAGGTAHYVYLYIAPLRWDAEMPKKPPQQGRLDKADAAAVKEKASNASPKS